MGLAVCLFLGAAATVQPSKAADAPVMVVGRVSYIEGDLLRYVPEEKDWVAVVRDTPFGSEDTLFSGSRGMAELIVPNGTWIRIGNSTQIQFFTLDTDLAEMDVASGVARFYNKNPETVIKVTSPFGYVLAYSGTVFDFYVGDNSVEVVAVKGRVSFVHSATGAKYDVAAGSGSILADQQQVSSGEGTVDPDWNRWNGGRENFWAAKARVRGRSVEYLPPNLRDEAYAFEENGRWERVPYEGAERWCWRPRVVVGWSPFTVGRWTDWYGDQTWIPAEPFGYVTHHYGHWIYLRNYWYWAPPVVIGRGGPPILDTDFFWSPGRVSWIHSGAYVGWVPLAPRETYYSYHRWGGPHDVVVTKSNFGQFNLNPRNYAYANRAIVVPRADFYRVSNYRDVRVTKVDRASIIKDYRMAPVVNNTVIDNYTKIKQRYNYTNVKVNEKPHNTVINRIQKNEAIIHGGREEKASLLQERVKGLPEGRINREARIEAPRVTNYIVPASEVNRPKSEIKLQQKEIKRSGEGTAVTRPGVAVKPGQQPAARPERVAPAKPSQPERVAPARPSPPEQPGQAARPERVSPARPVPPEQPAARPERVAPAKPSQPERVAPARPSPPEQPGQAARPERVSPARPVPPEQPAARPERVAPAKPSQPERVAPARPSPPEQPGQAARPERVSPARPVPPEQPAARPERVAPAKPSQPERVAPARPSPSEQPGQAARPERVSPARPAPPEQPAARPERVAPAKPSQPERVAPTRPSPPEQPGQAARPERVSPARPAPPEQPAARPERVAPAKPSQPERVAPTKPSPPERPGQAVEPDRTKKQKEPPDEREDQPEQREKKR